MRGARSLAAALLLAVSIAPAADPRAKNVILFIGDAGGIPTLNAASLHGYGQPHSVKVRGQSAESGGGASDVEAGLE